MLGAWILKSILPHRFVTLGKMLNLSVLHFPYLENGCNDGTYPPGIVGRTDEMIIGEGLGAVAGLW